MSETGLTPPQAAYLDWLMTPLAERSGDVPADKSSYAKSVGVNRRTLYDWERKPAFRQEWEKRARAVQGSPERLQAVLDALYGAATHPDGPSVQAAKLWLETLEKIQPPTRKVETTSTKKVEIESLTDEELEALLAQGAAEELERRAAKGNGGA